MPQNPSLGCHFGSGHATAAYTARSSLCWHPVARLAHRTKKSKGGNRYAIKVQRKQKKREFAFPFDVRTKPVDVRPGFGSIGLEPFRLAQVSVGKIIVKQIFIPYIQVLFEQIGFEPFTVGRSVQKPQHSGAFFIARSIVARQHPQKLGFQQTIDRS